MSTAMRGGCVLIVALVAACACGRAGGGGGTTGSGSGGGGGTGSAGDCEAIRDHVRGLYAAVSGQSDTFVTDNTAMVLAECAREPGRVAACARRASSVEALERTCLAPLDDEGSEGDVFRNQ